MSTYYYFTLYDGSGITASEEDLETISRLMRAAGVTSMSELIEKISYVSPTANHLPTEFAVYSTSSFNVYRVEASYSGTYYVSSKYWVTYGAGRYCQPATSRRKQTPLTKNRRKIKKLMMKISNVRTEYAPQRTVPITVADKIGQAGKKTRTRPHVSRIFKKQVLV